MATLTRQEMEAVIRGGGSIMHQHRIITRVDDLPTEGDLAEGDAAATQAALDGIAAQRAALDDQERKLLASRAPTAPAAAKGKKTPTAAPGGDGANTGEPPSDPHAPPPGGEGA